VHLENWVGRPWLSSKVNTSSRQIDTGLRPGHPEDGPSLKHKSLESQAYPIMDLLLNIQNPMPRVCRQL
jgi:hypothetical protein